MRQSNDRNRWDNVVNIYIVTVTKTILELKEERRMLEGLAVCQSVCIIEANSPFLILHGFLHQISSVQPECYLCVDLFFFSRAMLIGQVKIGFMQISSLEE